MENNQIPPKNEWPNLTINQLYEVKNKLLNKYWSMQQINASFANSYLGFVNYVDAIIQFKENEAQTATEH